MNTPMDEKQRDDDTLTAHAKAAFDDSVERLDAATLSKLNQGRQAALAELSNSRSARRWLRWMPATGVAAAALVTVMVMQGPSIVNTPDPDITDFEILMGDDSLEMIEDLEFYSWIEAADLDPTDNVG
jgi:hypothetical protein